MYENLGTYARLYWKPMITFPVTSWNALEDRVIDIGVFT